MSEPIWKATNRAHWDEKVALHLGPRGYKLASLRAGHGRFTAIEEAELWPVDGSRVLHLQCHFGSDSLKLAQRGATVVGLDFSAPAIDAARRLAEELGLADRARFVHADLYDAPRAIPEGAAFDMVFVTWGAIVWLPDIYRWAEIVCHFLKPGGSLYLAEAHPAAMVFDDAAVLPDGRPGYFAPYFSREPVVMEETHDYIDETTTVANATTYTWVHPIHTTRVGWWPARSLFRLGVDRGTHLGQRPVPRQTGRRITVTVYKIAPLAYDRLRMAGAKPEVSAWPGLRAWLCPACRIMSPSAAIGASPYFSRPTTIASIAG